MQQWTYVYWDADRYVIMRQVPDAAILGKVHSTIIAKGTHQIASLNYNDPAYYLKYAEVQMQLGSPYTNEEWPMRTCVESMSKE